MTPDSRQRIRLAALALIFIAVSFPIQGNAEIQVERADNFQYVTGVAPDWSNPLYISNEWDEFNRLTMEDPHKGLFWIRMDVYLDGEEVPDFDWEYNVRMIASHEAFWDDVSLGMSGRPAEDAADEIPGDVWHTYLIPNEHLTPGKHTITIRGSAHQRATGMKLLREGFMRPFSSNWRYVSLWSLIPTMFVSIGIVVGLYFLMLYFTDDRKPEYLAFFVLLESLTAYGFAIQWDHLVGYTYNWEWLSVATENVSAILVLLALPLYFLFKHNAPYPWRWMGATIAVAIVFGTWISPNAPNLAWFASFGSALIASVYYGRQSRSFYWWESLGLLLCIVGILTQDLENTFLVLPALFSVVLLTHAIAMQQRKAALERAVNLETQLRGELVRKHIQPHFLLNTLTSLMEWVETDPERGSEFISELAEEFRLMSHLSSQTVVDLGMELEMCDRHLAIMSLRLRKDCSLQRNDIIGDEPIPPAIFHTLIENAFSHNIYKADKLKFEIFKEALDGQWVRYRLLAPRGDQQTSSFRKLGGGTGLKYIKARLKQGFDSHWRLRDDPTDTHWTTMIDVDYAHLKRRQELQDQPA
jgi:hypothetical protein